MTFKRFIELWTHRFKKIKHLINVQLEAKKSLQKLLKIKQTLQPTQRLIAIIRTEHFGDIVATEPISRQIRMLHPTDHLVWIVKPIYHELVSTNPHIDSVHKEFCVAEREILLQSGVFDHVYELQFRNNSHCKMCNKFVDNPIALDKGIDSLNYFNFGNLLEVFSSVCNLPTPADTKPQLYLQDKHRNKVDQLLLPANFIVIHCKSNYHEKDWAPENWRKLINWLIHEHQYTVIEIGLESVIGEFSHPNFMNLCGQLSILETAEVINRAKFFVGLDSGPSHLANATNTFGFILMGNLVGFTDYNPYSGNYGDLSNCIIIREEGKTCSAMSFEHVLPYFEKQLSSVAT